MYPLAVKIESIEKRKRNTGLLHVFAGCFLVMGTATYFKTSHFQNLIAVFPSFIIALASIVYGLFRKKLDALAKYNPYLRILQFVGFAKLGISMIGLGSSWNYVSMLCWAVVSLLLLFTERRVFHDTDLVVKKEGIFIPGFFNRQLPWSAIKDVVIRNDYITIFKTNEKYLQFELMSDIDALELQKLNAFCKEQVNEFAKPLESN